MTRKLTGCRNCMVALYNEESSSFDAPQPIKDLEEFNYTYTYAEGSNYADNQQNIYMKKPTGADLGLVFSDLPLKMESILMGKKYHSGGITTNTNNKAKQVALLFQETYSDGSYINKVFYNSKLSKDEKSGKTEGENIEFTPINLTGRALPLDNGDIDYSLDSSDPAVDKTQLDKWFTEVQFMADTETVDVLYTGYTSGAVTEISLQEVTFDTATKKFIGVPSNTTTFTFKIDGTLKTATKSGSSWNFA